jgi:serine/threonine protein kinase
MLEPGQILHNRYKLQQQLGHTAAGRQTWLATDLQTKTPQPIIVKLLAFNPQMQWEDVKLFEREAQVLQHLDHPQIPRYRDSFAIDAEAGKGLPMFGLVQDYIEGKSLQELLDKGYKFTLTEIQRIAEQALEILVYLHELSPPVLHRDIKPSNLILDGNNRLYLVDFGSVQERAKAEGVSFTVVGTGGYAPPEQLWGKAVASSDLYALGATLIYLLTGVAPATLPQSNLRIEWMERVKVNPDFALWLNQLIDPVVENRFPTAREALKALYDNMIRKGAEINSPPLRPAVKTSARGKRLFTVTSLILAIVTGTMTLYGIQKAIKLPAISSVHDATGLKLDIDEVEVLNYSVFSLWFRSIDIKLSEKETERLFQTHRHGESSDCSVNFDPVTRVLSIREMEECSKDKIMWDAAPGCSDCLGPW